MRLLTHSRLSSFQACPRRHWFAYVTKRRSIEQAEALRFGTLVHKILQIYWTCRQLLQGVDQRTEEVFAAALRFAEGFDEYLRAKALVMVSVYMGLWDQVECEVLGVEQEFRMPLYDPETGEVSEIWAMAGKIDVIIRRYGKIISPVEHKTTSDEARPGGAYRQRLYMDGQVSQYFRGSRALNYEPDKLIYDILRKPKQRPLIATPLETRFKQDGELRKNARDHDETADEYGERVIAIVREKPEEYIIRLEIERDENQEKSYAFNVWQYAGLIEESERTGIAPYNPNSCFLYDQACEFWPVCTGQASINDPTKYLTKGRASEELTI
jgi:hypothetical protein